MTNQEILSHIDHTLLTPYATWGEIENLCREAAFMQTASVCIPPSYISRARDSFPELVIGTVIGFPLGYNTAAAKAFEAHIALMDGADELDMVIDIGDLKNGYLGAIFAEITALRELAEQRIVKVIIETCYLTEAEKIALCECVTEAGADYIKTSTGFGSLGAQLADIELFKEHLGSNVKIKASGGIRTREEMEQFLLAGCDRIGTSSASILIEKCGD